MREDSNAWTGKMAKTKERIKNIRQQAWNRRKRKIKSISIVLLIIILIICALNTKRILTAILWDKEIFHIKELKIIPEEYQGLLTGILETENLGNLIFFDIDKLHSRILKIREVERAFVTKEFPSTLKIELIIRQPWVIIESKYGALLIDKEGKVLIGQQSSSYLFQVSGIKTDKDSVLEEDLWKLSVFHKIEKWYNFYNIQQYFRMDKIFFRKTTEIVLTEKENSRSILITDNNIKETFEKIKIILGQCENSGKGWEYIDARFKNPAVRYKNQ